MRQGVEIMRHIERRRTQPRMDLLDDLDDVVLRFRIDGCCGLIKKEYFRFLRQCAGYGDALVFASGQVADRLCVQVGSRHLIERSHRTRTMFRAWPGEKTHSAIHAREHRIQYRQRQSWINMFYLGHVTGPASNIMPPSAAGISTEHLYTPMVGVPESIDQREQRRFTSPVWADDAYELAGIYAHIDVIQRVVSPVRPLRHHVATLIGEVHAPREEPPTERVLRPGRGLFLEDEGAARLVVFPHFID